MGDKSPSATGNDAYRSDKRDEPTRQTIDPLSVPVPTPEEWDATVAQIGKRWSE